MSNAPKRTRKVVNLALATALVASSTPAEVLGQQTPPAAATETPTFPPAIRAMTPEEKAEYDGWVEKAEAATEARHWTDAESFLRKILAREEATFGPQHPEVAVTNASLARIYEQQGRHRDVEPMRRRALAIREKVLGLEHPDTARSLNNLAANLDAQGRCHAQARRRLGNPLGLQHRSRRQ